MTDGLGYTPDTYQPGGDPLDQLLGDAVPMRVAEPLRLPVMEPVEGLEVVEAPQQRRKQDVIDVLLGKMLELKGSDLHLQVGVEPTIRVQGRMVKLEGMGRVTDEFMEKVIFEQLLRGKPASKLQQLEETNDCDTSYAMSDVSRFRVNLHREQGHWGAVLRTIPIEIVPLDKLGLPDVLTTFGDYPRGIVLITGPTGSGKSTTLAGIVDLVNRKHQHHIVTLEDPIEFVHQSKRSLIRQREIGADTESFAAGMKGILRQDPDIILLGEMRDPETIKTALTAAETGHLVFATLHTSSAKDTVSRIVAQFPAEEQPAVRSSLAAALVAVVCQTLCRTPNGRGRVPAVEIMVANTAIRNLVKENKIDQIPTSIQGAADIGSTTLEMNLASLVKQSLITEDEARSKAQDLKSLNEALQRAKETGTYNPGAAMAASYH